MPILGNGLSTVLRTIKHHAIRRSSRTIPRRSLIILGLESSADDSCAAVVTDSREIKANVVIRQDDEHRQYGGIHPYVAIKTHQSNMPLAIRSALLESGCGMDDIDGIAFTRGPGMPGCLSVAAGAAKALAAALGKPLVGVHHMHAHAVTPFLTQPPNELPEYPFLTFLLTGGHTLLLLAKDPQTFQVLADTVDSSIGAAYDHASRVLSLPSHPKGAGAALEAFCAHSTPDSEPGNIVEPFITPMRNKMAFSFSGVLSQLAIPLQRHGHEPDGLTKLAFARAFQEAAARHLTDRLLMALSTCRQDGITIKHLVVSGGVASNMFIRQRLQECLETASTEQSPPIKLICPPRELCTDNAAMIAWASMSRFQAQDYDDFSISLRPTWKIADLTRPDTVDKQWHGRRSRAPKDPLLELEHIE